MGIFPGTPEQWAEICAKVDADMAAIRAAGFKSVNDLTGKPWFHEVCEEFFKEYGHAAAWVKDDLIYGHGQVEQLLGLREDNSKWNGPVPAEYWKKRRDELAAKHPEAYWLHCVTQDTFPMI